MCGLWASLGVALPPRDVIRAVAHRGPDGEGWEEHTTSAGPLVLAHRRLAILDTSAAGHQPMNRNGLSIVYNGEIYNHAELRAELEGQGHIFSTSSDTEVLLAAWRQWGAGALQRLNGMFSFVLWEHARQRLHAVRDRFGVKPLYWLQSGKGIAFASEIKQFLALPGFSARLNLAAARDFLTVGLLDHNVDTMLCGVQAMAPGWRMEMDVAAGNLSPSLSQWYHLPAMGSLELPAAKASERFADLLDQAVRLRLRSDVPVGACLSGGLDSSAIVCLANQQQPVVTVSACYEDPAVDERPFMEAVTSATGCTNVRIFPDPARLPDLAHRIVWHQDGPFTSTSVFAQFTVFEAARQAGLPVMLDGQGADEQLAGYHPAFDAYHAGLLRSFRWTALAAAMAARRRRHGHGLASQAAGLTAALARPLLHRLRGVSTPPWLASAGTTSLPATPDLNHFLHSQFTGTSLPALLHWEDRSSMAHGVEARLPFLDVRLVELLMGLGHRHKIVEGETKWLMRRALANVLPPAIRNRHDKIGFACPDAHWLQRSDIRALLDEGLAAAPALMPELFSTAGVAALRAELRAGQAKDARMLWRIASFAWWIKGFGVTS